MSPKYLLAAGLAVFLSTPISAQSVKTGIEAWQRADYSAAVAIWRPLAEAGDADAQFNLGQAYRLGRGVPINLALAKGWFERAATSGHLDAETTLGLLLFQNGDQAQGLKWLKQAAEKGEPRALLVYGTALYNGDGVTQNRLLGYAYVSRAAAQGLVPAKDTLAQLDELMPPSDRQKAAALAAAIPKGAQPATKREKPPRLAQVKPAPEKAPPPAKTKSEPAAPPRSLANPAWGLFTARRRGSALSATVRKSGDRRPGPVLHPGRFDDPAPGRPLRQQGSRGGCMRFARNRLLPSPR
jgi:hypothetical protein